ncbi:hypothetical protein SVA_1802 [Sulfurifustis variabilis]|uniref:Uncharacterized protein n=1 Tax=Sulfurifustis variabilis TaxID=1675686 RepID=A0A1B4V4A5_9GAMM|nr:hypothetical protein [Sulfurifustis variabilis]BAU48356.1 hypothetical protein SVA_1802 [Sulfurifustis variabilis]
MKEHEKLLAARYWQGEAAARRVVGFRCRRDVGHGLLRPARTGGRAVMVCDACGFVQIGVPQSIVDVWRLVRDRAGD